MSKPVLLVVIAIFGPIIYLTDKGPIFYNAERVGKSGNLFKMYKFRSMKVQIAEEEKAEWTTENDPRKTKIGTLIRKTSIDELPQLINVLKGDMSLVGKECRSRWSPYH